MTDKIKPNAVLAIIYTCFAYGIFTISDTIIKSLVVSYSVFFISFVGSFVTLSCAAFYGFVKYGYKGFKTKYLKWHILRGVMMTASTYSGTMALKTLPLDGFYAIIFASPFVLTILAHLLLKETLNKKQIYGILAGFLCVLFMVQPSSSLFQIGAIYVGIAMFFYSCNCLIMRGLKGRNPVFLFPVFSSIVICFTSFLIILFLPEVGFPTSISFVDSVLFLSFGVLIAFGIAFLAMGLQSAPHVATVAPFHYTQMIWGIILGYFVFGDVPNMVTLIGAFGIIITGIYVINHETKKYFKP